MNFAEKIFISLKTLRNLPTFFADYLGLLNGDVLYETTQGIKCLTRSHTPDVAELIVTLSGKNYPLSLISIPQKPIIIDIGAYIGDFALYSFQQYKNNQPNIYAIEPDKNNYSYLCRNIELNNAQRFIKPIRKAMCSYTGRGYIHTYEKPADEYSVTSQKIPHSLLCQTTTLPSLFKNIHTTYADIVKIDIEGGEYNLLRDNATKLLLNKRVRYIFIEYHQHPNYDYQWIIRQLANCDLLLHRDHVLTFQNKNFK